MPATAKKSAEAYMLETPKHLRNGEMKHHSDADLYYLLKNEKNISESAFSELYARHSGRIYAYCRVVFMDVEQAEDIFQETFTRFYESAQKERTMTNVPAFLLMIARNLCLNTKRDMKKTVEFQDVHQITDDYKPEKREMLQLIEMAMELLPDELREPFILREYDDQPYDEIAEIMGTTAVAIRIRVHRARKRIREILEPYLTEMSN
jgi:RNA polymerase sigma-70 factor, ECF subfamily